MENELSQSHNALSHPPENEEQARLRTVYVTRVETFECMSAADDEAIDAVLAGEGRSVDQETIAVRVEP